MNRLAEVARQQYLKENSGGLRLTPSAAPFTGLLGHAVPLYLPIPDIVRCSVLTVRAKGP